MTILHDVKHAARVMRATPGVTVVLLLTIALGTGATTALFTVLYGVLLRPLPYPEPERLMRIRSAHAADGVTPSLSFEDFRDFAREQRAFQYIAMSGYWTFNLTGSGPAQRIVGARVSGEFFPMLGIAPLLGRTILPDDDRPGGANSVVIGYGLWRTVFGGDPEIVGRSVSLNGVATTIVGVMPASFQFPTPDIHLWGALADQMGGVPRNSRFMAGYGRLRADVSAEQAEADLAAIAARLAERYPETNAAWSVRVSTVREALTEDIRAALMMLFAAVVVVLVIACANIANLLSARAAARYRESALRVALGASRMRLTVQHLIEAGVLAACGGLLGVAVASLAVDAARRFAPPTLPRVDEIAMDAPVLGFAFAATLVSTLLFGVVPARQAWQTHIAPALHDAGRSATGGRGGRRLRAALVIAEIALAVPLLIAGGLLVRSFNQVLDVDPGFRPERLAAIDVFLVGPRYRTIADQKNYVTTALDRLSVLPAIEHVAAVSQVPFGQNSTLMPFRIDGQTAAPGERRIAHYRAASPSYLDTMGMSLKRGRWIDRSDTAEGQPVAVVNETMARRYWGDRDPIGARFQWEQTSRPFWLTVVGVVTDVRAFRPEEPDAAAVYVPFAQRTLPFMRWMTFVARAQGDPGAALSTMRKALVDLDPNQPVHGMTTIQESMERVLAERRFNTMLMSTFAAVGAALAAVGLFGVLSFAVAQRTREIGVRMALGARPRDVVGLVVKDGAALTGAGLAIGGIAAAAVTRLLTSLLFGVTPIDPVTYIAIAGIVAVIAVTACYIPARRAAAVDPVVAMKE